MKREYRDVRFPGMTVSNDGSTRFTVRQGETGQGTFESWEAPGGRISEAFAARRAEAYFERMAEGITPAVRRAALSEAVGLRAVRESVDDKDHSHIFNNPPDTSAEIDRLMAAERAETDPERKRRLRHNIMVLMQRENVAESVVAFLIES